jgi:hypothetical protein
VGPAERAEHYAYLVEILDKDGGIQNTNQLRDELEFTQFQLKKALNENKGLGH